MSKKRVQLAMAHREPDRVPVMCQLALGHYFLNTDFDSADIWFDSETFVRALLDRQCTYGFDGILLNLPGRPADWRKHLCSREESDGKIVLTWKNGLVTVIPPDDNPYTLDENGRNLQRVSLASGEGFRPGLPRAAGYVWSTWHAPGLWDMAPDGNMETKSDYPSWFTNAIVVANRLAPELSIHVEVFSPFTHLMEFLGYQEALMAMIDEPERCRELLAGFTRMVKAQIDCFAEHQPDAMLVSSAFAGAGFISRAFYRAFVLPYEREIVQHVRALSLVSYVHTCGAIGDRLDLMAAAGFDGIDTLDPPPLGTVDLRLAKAEFGDRFFFKGNLDAVNEMLGADDAQFEAAVKARIEIGMPGGGYILSSACSVAPQVKPRRLSRLVELAEEYGRYSS